LHSGIKAPHGQSAGLPDCISTVIAQGFVIATLAMGASAATSDINRTNMVRGRIIEVRSSRFSSSLRSASESSSE
jgi:hypothetical protein